MDTRKSTCASRLSPADLRDISGGGAILRFRRSDEPVGGAAPIEILLFEMKIATIHLNT